ncbi:hypothetical protein Y032_0080g1343 [Ancylostoma ceylanicum]|uniref:Uncharacterized protein n=1 Tax=Ancylostoma ceylanicum TaxID=53326 RepID=A0A016TSX9_9BILA|nr:hypothetical protein Y032_0080g1343 [Ancylostoma ceylanicum]
MLIMHKYVCTYAPARFGVNECCFSCEQPRRPCAGRMRRGPPAATRSHRSLALSLLKHNDSLDTNTLHS